MALYELMYTMLSEIIGNTALATTQGGLFCQYGAYALCIFLIVLFLKLFRMFFNLLTKWS